MNATLQGSIVRPAHVNCAPSERLNSQRVMLLALCAEREHTALRRALRRAPHVEQVIPLMAERLLLIMTRPQIAIIVLWGTTHLRKPSQAVKPAHARHVQRVDMQPPLGWKCAFVARWAHSYLRPELLSALNARPATPPMQVG